MRTQPLRWFVVLLALLLAARQAHAVRGLVSHGDAERFGLTRAWYAQMPVNAAHSRIVHVTLHRGMAMVQTDSAILVALDAETGRTLWSARLGNPRYPSLAPGANDEFVAVVNGSTLYVLDRTTGELKWKHQVPGSPSAGPALSPTHVFVPMFDGSIEGYQLDRQSLHPWVYRSAGRTNVQPIVGKHLLGWTTDAGLFNVASTDELKILYRLETREAIVSRPAYWSPRLYATSRDGSVYAVNRQTRNSDWKYATGSPIRQPPAAVEGKVYVVPERGGMVCLDGARGTLLWSVPGLTHFLAASPTRVYGYHRNQAIAVLDARGGGVVGRIPAEEIAVKVINHESDRLYLATESGIVQCLREAGREQPTVYRPDGAEKAEAEPRPKAPPAAQPPAPPAAEAPPAEAAAPAAEAEPGQEMPAEDQPADKQPGEPAPAADDDNPFGV